MHFKLEKPVYPHGLLEGRKRNTASVGRTWESVIKYTGLALEIGGFCQNLLSDRSIQRHIRFTYCPRLARLEDK